MAEKRNEDRSFLILDGLIDPHNLGLLCVLLCTGAHELLFRRRRAVDLPHQLRKASKGAIEYILLRA